jgi:hypothetical protein
MAGAAGLEPVTSAVTGQRSNQLSYAPASKLQKLRSRQVNLRKGMPIVKRNCANNTNNRLRDLAPFARDFADAATPGYACNSLIPS